MVFVQYFTWKDVSHFKSIIINLYPLPNLLLQQMSDMSVQDDHFKTNFCGGATRDCVVTGKEGFWLQCLSVHLSKLKCIKLIICLSINCACATAVCSRSCKPDFRFQIFVAAPTNATYNNVLSSLLHIVSSIHSYCNSVIPPVRPSVWLLAVTH